MRITTPKAPKSRSSSLLSPMTKQPQKPVSPIKPTCSPMNSKSLKKSPSSQTPPKKPPSKQPTHQQLISKMQRNRQRLCNTLDTYTLLIRSNNPIRCLQHNSNISIYCETQQKLLCSNCIFSKLDHKYHKVVPVDKVHEKLERDVEIMQRQIEREVTGIEDVYQRVYVHYENEQKAGHEAMSKLEKLYQDARIMMDECEIQAKKRILLQLQRVQTKHETLLAELNFLKNVYKDQYAQIQPINDANFLIYEHVMCNTVVNQGKFSHIKWKVPVNQLQKVELDQCKKIVYVLDALDRYLRERLRQKK